MRVGFARFSLSSSANNPLCREFCPSAAGLTLLEVVRALLICSDDACTALYEVLGSIEEIETLACSCGCGLAVVGWPEALEEEQDGLELNLLAA